MGTAIAASILTFTQSNHSNFISATLARLTINFKVLFSLAIIFLLLCTITILKSEKKRNE